MSPVSFKKNLDDLRWGKKQEETKMISQTLVEIERSISSLSIEEQLWLLERIACRVRINPAV